MKTRRRPDPSRVRDGVARSRDGATLPPAIAALLHPAVGAALAALLLYLPTLGHGFVRDDHQLIGDNNFMHNPGYLKQLLLSDFWGSVGGESGLWRPLILLSYWIDGRLGGWLPSWYHGVNVFSHALCTAVLALLMLRAGAPRAATWIAAVWFAVMPAHVESVAWISGRTDIWCALFGLLALWLHEKSTDGAPWGWRSAAVVALALALLSKETAIVIPVVLAMLVIRRRESLGSWSTISELVPYALLALVWAWIHLRMAPGAIAATPGWRHPGPNENVWTALSVLPMQIAFLLPGFPVGPDWAISPARSVADLRVLLGIAANALAVLLLVRTWRRRDGLGAAAWLFWLPLALLALLPLTRYVVLNGSRHLYLASAGAAWLAGVGLQTLWKRGLAPTTLPRWIVPAAAAVALVVCVNQAFVGAAGWKSDETMYRAMIKAQPRNATGYLGLALVKIGQRQDRTALQALRAAEQIDSTRYELATYRAAVASRSGQWEEVIAWARKARARGAKEADPSLMEVAALQELQRLPEASRLLDTLMFVHKTDPDVAAAFGREMLLEKRATRAVGPLQYAVSWNPNDAQLAMMYGDALVHIGQLAKAREQIQRAVGLEPGNIEAWVKLASVCHLQGDFQQRDLALRNAGSLPGADQEQLRQTWAKMQAMQSELPEEKRPAPADLRLGDPPRR